MPDYMAIIGDYSAYIDKFGLVQPGPIQSDGTVGTSQNGIRYTAEMAYVLWKLNYHQDMDRLLKVIRKCEVEEGLYIRSPDGEFTSIDDYTGLALISWMYEPKIAGRILFYGYKNQGFYGVGTKFWLYRFPALFGALRIAAGLKPTIFQSFFFFASLIVADSQQDSFAINWMLSKIYEGQSRILDWAISYNRRRFRQVYSGGYGEMFAAYSQVPNHPHVKYLANDF